MTRSFKANPDKARPARLEVIIAGPRVGEARMALSDLAEVLRRAQQALKRVGQVLFGQGSQGQGRKKREIEDLCELYVVDWRPGSAVTALELAEPPRQLSMFAHIGEESLEAFVSGLACLRTRAPSRQPLPRGFDAGVLETLDALGGVLGRGAETIRFLSRDPRSASATFDEASREAVGQYLGEPRSIDLVTKMGRLEVISGHGALTGRLWEADGTRWSCEVGPEHAAILPEAWLRAVKATGRAVLAEGRESQLKVETLMPLDRDAEPESGMDEEEAPFWTTTPLADLARQQAVGPVQDLDELAALWPADDDPEALLRYVLAERAERRALSRVAEEAG
ncbi:MAG: hypothetical protein IH608_03355 [Proteobacteria bacterium]|nr:hypothetical protein [Pseudomonadota bacterium]